MHDRSVQSGVIFTLIFVVATFMAQSIKPGQLFFGLERDVVIAVTTSLAGSGFFFAVFQWLHARREKVEAAVADRLRRIETELGIRNIYSSKSQEEAIKEYKQRIMEAKQRIWAIGRSNDQFLQQHSAAIKARRITFPRLDVRVFFFDPDATVTNTAQKIENLPLINLFDFPRQLYTSEKRALDARHYARNILVDEGLGAKVFFTLIPSYFSMMIVDDIAFFFPYLDDASSNPMLMVDTTCTMGSRLEAHVNQLQSNPLLCREIKPEQLAPCASR